MRSSYQESRCESKENKENNVYEDKRGGSFKREDIIICVKCLKEVVTTHEYCLLQKGAIKASRYKESKEFLQKQIICIHKTCIYP